MFETRMKSEVSLLQTEHRRQVEDLTKRHELMVASQFSKLRMGRHSSEGAAQTETEWAPYDGEVEEKLDEEESNAPSWFGMRGKKEEEAEGHTKVKETPAQRRARKERRLPGFYAVGTTAAAVGCFEFAGANTEVDMNSANCRTTGKICSGCFLATADSNDKVLEIIKCSTARYKASAAISNAAFNPVDGSGSHVLVIEVINSDTDSTLTIKGCNDATCASPTSTYTLAASNSAVGYCYSIGATNVIYWQTSSLQNAATFDFTGKTISDLGTVTTANIDGGTIDGTDITMSGKTLDMAGGTLTLVDASVAAAKVTGGIFKSGQSYSFAGSTVANLGEVTTADINGGTIDATTIATSTITTSDITVQSGKTLDVSAGTLTLGNGQVLATKVGAGVFAAGSGYSFASSTIVDLGQVTTADINGGTIDNCNIKVGTSGTPRTLDISEGTITLNAGQIPATAISAAQFNAGSSYSFASSTIGDLGQVTTAAIVGGTVNNVVIGGATPAAGAFTTLSTSSGNKFTLGDVGTGTSAAGSSPTITMNKQMGTITSYAGTPQNNLAAGTLLTFSLSNSQIAGATSRIFAIIGSQCSGSTSVTVVSSQATGASSGTITVKNIHASTACGSVFKIHFLVLN